MAEQWLWKMRWGDAVLACGAGELPFELRAAKRPLRGDRALVQWGALTYELESRPAPERAFAWGLPDFQFVKVLVICLMAFGALVMVLRERIAELERERLQQVLILRPETLAPAPLRLARWDDGGGSWRRGATARALPAKDLARIRRFPQKVKELGRDEAPRRALLATLARADTVADLITGSGRSQVQNGAVLGGLIGRLPVDADHGLVIGRSSGQRKEPAARGVLKMLGTPAVTNTLSYAPTQVEEEEGGVVGGVIGGVSHDSLPDLSVHGGLRPHLKLTQVDDTDLTLMDIVPSNTLATRLLRASTSDVRQCLSPGFAGALNVSLVVRPDGTVTAANVSGVNGPTSDCVRRVVEKLRFGGVDTAQTVTARWNAG